jgi:hypothetical protein
MESTRNPFDSMPRPTMTAFPEVLEIARVVADEAQVMFNSVDK